MVTDTELKLLGKGIVTVLEPAVFSFCVDVLPDALTGAAQLFPANPLKLETSTRNLNTALEAESKSTTDIPNGRELAQLLEEMATVGVADAFGDPLEWQSQTRQDKLLPGREEPG